MKKIIYIFMSLAALFSVAGCDDFLDKQPQSSVTPSSYFKAEADLAAYSINLYAFTSIGPGSYGISTFGSDNGTDNQAAVDYSSFWVPGEWRVSATSGVWNFSQIRHCNYFLEQVLPKHEAGEIQGSAANIRHYIGEIYLIRASPDRQGRMRCLCGA